MIPINQSGFNGMSAKLFEAQVLMFLGFGDVVFKYIPIDTMHCKDM